MVVKISLNDSHANKKYYFTLLKLNTITKHLALIFNKKLESLKEKRKLNVEKGISFIDTFIFKDNQSFYLLEPYLGTEFKKFTNNAFYFDETYDIDIQTVIAFSHWTFEYTNHRYMVTDLQGVGMVLTDSTLNTMSHYFPEIGDLGPTGIASFFANHECNKICKVFGLNRNEKIYENLQNYLPKINTSVFLKQKCFNKFCGNKGRKVQNFEKYICEDCLEKINKKDFIKCKKCFKIFSCSKNLFLFLQENSEVCEDCKN